MFKGGVVGMILLIVCDLVSKLIWVVIIVLGLFDILLLVLLLVEVKVLLG